MNGFLNNFITFSKQVFSGLKQAKNFRLSSLRKVFSLMGKTEKIIVTSLLALAILSLAWSVRVFYFNHTAAAPASGGQYQEGMLGQPVYINPLLAHQETDLALTKLIFSGLYKYDNSGQIIPDLAESQPIISPDQKQYTVNLKRNVKWHNDKTFTADDVVFTIQSLKDPSYKSPLRQFWMSTSVEKLSDYSVRFTTKDISGPFINNLTVPILPEYVWSKVEPQNFLLSEYNLKAIGTGPYSIKEIKKQASGKIQQLTLNAFSNFYQDKPKVSQIIVKFYDTDEDMLNAFHSREISGFGYVPLGSPLYVDKEQDDANVYSLPLPQYQVIFFNLGNKILAEQPVRQALALATDKQKIIDEVFKGNALLPSSPLLPPGAGSAPALTPNLDQAKSLLDAAGWKIDPKTNLRTKKNQVLEFTILTNDFLLNSKAAENLADQWRKLDIKVNVSLQPTKQLTDSAIKARSFDALLFPLKFGADPDPFAFWHSSQVKDPGYNLSGFADQNADRLITEARTTTNQQLRQQKYQELDKLLNDKLPAVFIDQAVYMYAVDKKVKNVGLDALFEPSQRFYDTPNWYINEKRAWKK